MRGIVQWMIRLAEKPFKVIDNEDFGLCPIQAADHEC
jgi:hypothetical protein